MVYYPLYTISQGLLCVTLSMMCRRSVYLGGKHVHYIFCLPTERNLSPHQMAELAITQLLRKPAKLNMLRILNILFLDEAGQISAEIVSVLDIILRRARQQYVFGSLLVVTTMDHT